MLKPGHGKKGSIEATGRMLELVQQRMRHVDTELWYRSLSYISFVLVNAYEFFHKRATGQRTICAGLLAINLVQITCCFLDGFTHMFLGSVINVLALVMFVYGITLASYQNIHYHTLRRIFEEPECVCKNNQ